jgi:hypothetical protein
MAELVNRQRTIILGVVITLALIVLNLRLVLETLAGLAG